MFRKKGRAAMKYRPDTRPEKRQPVGGDEIPGEIIQQQVEREERKNSQRRRPENILFPGKQPAAGGGDRHGRAQAVEDAVMEQVGAAHEDAGEKIGVGEVGQEHEEQGVVPGAFEKDAGADPLQGDPGQRMSDRQRHVPRSGRPAGPSAWRIPAASAGRSRGTGGAGGAACPGRACGSRPARCGGREGRRDGPRLPPRPGA